MGADERRARVRQRLIRMHRDGRRRRNIDRLLDFCVARQPPSSVFPATKRGGTGREGRTSEALELERFDLGDDVLVLVRGQVVVLDQVDDVGERKHAGEAVRGRIVQRSRDDAWRSWWCQPGSSPPGSTLERDD